MEHPREDHPHSPPEGRIPSLSPLYTAFSLSPQAARANSLKLHQERFRLDIRENSSMEWAAQPWDSCTGQRWSLHPWTDLKATWMWHGAVLGERLDSMILEGFSILNHSRRLSPASSREPHFGMTGNIYSSVFAQSPASRDLLLDKLEVVGIKGSLRN